MKHFLASQEVLFVSVRSKHTAYFLGPFKNEPGLVEFLDCMWIFSQRLAIASGRPETDLLC